MATNDTEEKPKYWQIALLVWFLTLSTIIIGLSFWALVGTPTDTPIEANLPVPPGAPGPNATVEQTGLYTQQTAEFVKLAAAYVAAVQASKAEPSGPPRLKAYKEVVVNGLLKLISDVLTAMFATVVGVKTLKAVKEYFMRKKTVGPCCAAPGK